MITSNNTVADILKQPLEKSTLELKKHFDSHGAVDLLYALGKAENIRCRKIICEWEFSNS